MNRIFISYARSDAGEVAEFLFQRLSDCGYEVWKDDHDIPLGTSFPRALSDALEEECEVLVLFSLAALKSEWVSDEVNMALTARRRVIPIVLAGVADDDIPLMIRNLNWLEMKDGLDDWQALDRLVNHLEGGKSIPRVYNLSRYGSLRGNGVLILGHSGPVAAELENPTSIVETAIELAQKALPYINAGAGIVPNGLSPIANTTLAFLLGTDNKMPDLYYPVQNAKGDFVVHKDVFVNLQEVRKKGVTYLKEVGIKSKR